MRWILLTAVMLALCSCPPADKPDAPGQQGASGKPGESAEQPDEFELYAQQLASEDGFYYELKRLQGLYTDPPGFSGISMGSADQQFDIGSVLEDGRAGLTLTDRESGEQWTLWGWVHDGETPPAVTVIKDQPTAGGYHLELSIGKTALSFKLLARWDHSRYLQVSRELMLGGMDLTQRLPEAYTNWTVDGPWLPYRMVPSYEGPYGVVLDHRANGEWHGSSHPGYAMVPAAAAYDRNHGVMLCVVDEHPRKCDRAYEAQYRVATDYSYGPLVRLRYAQYDGTQDVFDKPFIVSGLPQRDSIVLEVFDVNSTSLDEKLVESETIEVIARIADIVHAYHFKPNSTQQQTPAALLNIYGWQETGDEEFIRNAIDNWNVIGIKEDSKNSIFSHSHSLDSDPVSDAEAAQQVVGLTIWEIGDKWIDNGAVVYQNQSPLSINRAESEASISNDELFAEYEDFDSLASMPETLTGQDFYRMNFRSSAAVAWVLRNFSYSDYLGEAYLIQDWSDTSQDKPKTGQTVGNAPFLYSCNAGLSLFTLKLSEVLGNHKPVLSQNGLGLHSPAIPGPQLLSCPLNYKELKMIASQPIVENRLAAYVQKAVFDRNPFVEMTQATLAEQVMCSVWPVRGHVLSKHQEQYAGFEAFAGHSTDLVKAAKDMRVLMCEPVSSGYLSGGEMPAKVDKIVAMIPGELAGSLQYWFAFHGTGGSVSVDEFNNITVTWDGFGFWREKLPVGFWIVEHPSPSEIKPGDAVLVRRRPLASGSVEGTDAV